MRVALIKAGESGSLTVDEKATMDESKVAYLAG